jgi:hypothetical protein
VATEFSPKEPSIRIVGQYAAKVMFTGAHVAPQACCFATNRRTDSLSFCFSNDRAGLISEERGEFLEALSGKERHLNEQHVGRRRKKLARCPISR